MVSCLVLLDIMTVPSDLGSEGCACSVGLWKVKPRHTARGGGSRWVFGPNGAAAKRQELRQRRDARAKRPPPTRQGKQQANAGEAQAQREPQRPAQTQTRTDRTQTDAAQTRPDWPPHNILRKAVSQSAAEGTTERPSVRGSVSPGSRQKVRRTDIANTTQRSGTQPKRSAHLAISSLSSPSPLSSPLLTAYRSLGPVNSRPPPACVTLPSSLSSS